MFSENVFRFFTSQTVRDTSIGGVISCIGNHAVAGGLGTDIAPLNRDSTLSDPVDRPSWRELSVHHAL